MEFFRLGARSVELRQTRTKNWPLETRLRYTLADDDAIDLTVFCTPRADAWKKHGLLGVFFASYIDAPEDLAIQFIGRSRPGTGDERPRWIRHLSPRHGESACHRPAGATWDPPLDEGFPIVLGKGPSDLEYVYPFYFGVTHGQAVMFFFERPTADGEIRFAQSPSGGGDGNPAWDFLYLRRRFAVGEEFSFRVRCVARPFRNRADVVAAYEAWSGEKVVDPDGR